MSQSITVCIYTYNESDNIANAIKSSRLLTENIMIIDSGSTDKTRIIAEKLKCRVVTTDYYRYVEPIRNIGLENVTTDWVFILDADERMTDILAKEIVNVISSETYSFYRVRRKNIFAGRKWLRYGGFGPDDDWQIRLINKKNFITWPKQIHSKPKISGTGSSLNNLLIHYFHSDLKSMVDKTAIFEDIESGLLYDAGRGANSVIFFRKFFGELYRRMIKKQGWRDGAFGIIESTYQAYSKTITYLYLYEKNKKSVTD